MNLVGLIVVGVGGALGAVTRALITEVIDRRVMTWFPVATFLINIVSCFIMGCIMQLVSSELLFDILGMGFLGGFSTLSCCPRPRTQCGISDDGTLSGENASHFSI